MQDNPFVYRNLYELTRPMAELERVYHELARRGIRVPDTELERSLLPRRIYRSCMESRGFVMEIVLDASGPEEPSFKIIATLRPKAGGGAMYLSYGPGHTSLWLRKIWIGSALDGAVPWLVPLAGKRCKGVSESNIYGSDLDSTFDFIRLCLRGE